MVQHCGPWQWPRIAETWPYGALSFNARVVLTDWIIAQACKGGRAQIKPCKADFDERQLPLASPPPVFARDASSVTMPRVIQPWEQGEGSSLDNNWRVRKLRESRRIRGDRNDDLMSLASERELFAQDRLTGALGWWDVPRERGILFYQDIFLWVLIY